MYLSKNIIDLEKGSYTFSDYFKMNITSKNLAKTFGYEFEKDKIDFEIGELNSELVEWVKDFYKKLFRLQKKINLDSEMAKREFLVAPIIYQLVQSFDIEVDIEANTYFDKTLKGSIDYVLNSKSNVFIAIEAKNSEVEKGIVQLTSELIAIDKILEEKSDFVYGAVTTGFSWCFVVLDRNKKNIIQNIEYFSIKELKTIVEILVSILSLSQTSVG